MRLALLTDGSPLLKGMPIVPHPTISETAAKHGKELLQRGFTIAQVVNDYGGVCQTITELAIEMAALFSIPARSRICMMLADALA